MNYTLITPTGKIYTFYLLATAKTWKEAYGGTLIVAKEQQLTTELNGTIIES